MLSSFRTCPFSSTNTERISPRDLPSVLITLSALLIATSYALSAAAAPISSRPLAPKNLPIFSKIDPALPASALARIPGAYLTSLRRSGSFSSMASSIVLPGLLRWYSLNIFLPALSSVRNFLRASLPSSVYRKFSTLLIARSSLA